MIVYEIRTFNGVSYFLDNVADFEFKKGQLSMAGISYTCYGRCA